VTDHWSSAPISRSTSASRQALRDSTKAARRTQRHTEILPVHRQVGIRVPPHWTTGYSQSAPHHSAQRVPGPAAASIEDQKPGRVARLGVRAATEIASPRVSEGSWTVAAVDARGP